MPELPEAEVVRAGLDPALRGATVTAVDVWDERSLKRHPGDAASFVTGLEGRAFASTARRGKFIWAPLVRRASSTAPADALVLHLGMSGQALLREPAAPLVRNERIRLHLEHPAHGPLVVAFVDQRIFGSMAIDDLVEVDDSTPVGERAIGAAPAEEGGEVSERALHGTAPAPVEGADATGEGMTAVSERSAPAAAPAPETIPRQARHIARDLLDPRFDEHRVLDLMARKRSGIKRVLLDQRVVSGIGNIYADEALWAARVHPEQLASSLSRVRARRLLDAARETLERALAEGGTSFDAQYLNVNGESGYFSRSLMAYGRDGEPCPRCGTPLRRAAFMNRSSHFCPRCQRRR